MQPFEKRSSEQLRFDIDCSRLLATGETITLVSAITAEPVTAPAIAFGAAAVNTVAAGYTDYETGTPRTASIGTVVQVQISGGKIPADALVQNYLLRLKLVTSLNPLVEATVRLKLNDTPAA